MNKSPSCPVEMNEQFFGFLSKSTAWFISFSTFFEIHKWETKDESRSPRVGKGRGWAVGSHGDGVLWGRVEWIRLVIYGAWRGWEWFTGLLNRWERLDCVDVSIHPFVPQSIGLYWGRIVVREYSARFTSQFGFSVCLFAVDPHIETRRTKTYWR